MPAPNFPLLFLPPLLTTAVHYSCFALLPFRMDLHTKDVYVSKYLFPARQSCQTLPRSPQYILAAAFLFAISFLSYYNSGRLFLHNSAIKSSYNSGRVFFHHDAFTSSLRSQDSGSHRVISPHSLEAIHNQTLGFEKVFMINMPERGDKRDLTRLASSITGFDVDIIDGVNAKKIPKVAWPARNFPDDPNERFYGSWRGHMVNFPRPNPFSR